MAAAACPGVGRIGQTSDNQIDYLSDMGAALGNAGGRLWVMRNGYALATEEGLSEIANGLRSMSEVERDALRGTLRIGIHWLPLCIYFAVNRGEYTLLDNADLIIHEAGHFFFRPFGRFLTYAGGTIMQLFLPSLLVWHFVRHEFRLGAQVSMFWLGHNLINISVYAADARSRHLPLLGGDINSHDWWNMLGMVGLLPYDHVFGHAFLVLAVVAFGALVLLPLKMWG